MALLALSQQRFSMPIAPLNSHATSSLDACEELIGLNAEGMFRTSKAKEYPPMLCSCIAQAFGQRIAQLGLNRVPVDADKLAAEFAFLASRVEPTKRWMPDYQPKI